MSDGEVSGQLTRGLVAVWLTSIVATVELNASVTYPTRSTIGAAHIRLINLLVAILSPIGILRGTGRRRRRSRCRPTIVAIFSRDGDVGQLTGRVLTGPIATWFIGFTASTPVAIGTS